MSEPGDDLTPLPDEEPLAPARLSRSPYLALGVAAVVVSTVFATVATLASTRGDDKASPSPSSHDGDLTTEQAITTGEETTADTSAEPAESSATTTSADETTTTTTTTDESSSADETTTTTESRTTTAKPTRTTTPKPPPNKAPTANIGGGCPATGFECTFNGSSSSDPDGSIASYTWTFGDDKGASGKNASHTYAEPGTYTVTLTVVDNDGKSDSDSITVTVTAPPTT